MSSTSRLAVCLAFAVPAPLASPAPAQQPRASQQLDAAAFGVEQRAAIACEGDRTVVLYSEGSTDSNTLHLVRSDGRAVDWSGAVRVDTDAGAAPSTKRPQEDSLAIAGNRVVAAWRDERHSDSLGAVERDVYVNVSMDGGASFARQDVWIDKGSPAGTGAVRDWRMSASSDSGADHVYVLCSTDATHAAPEELFLASSHDGGSTFGPAVPVSTAHGTGADVDVIALASQGLAVHVAWCDDRNGQDDLFYRRSLDGGATWGAEMRLDASGPADGDVEAVLSMAVDGALVAIAWLEESSSATNEEVRVVVSQDGGATFAADLRVGGYDPLIHDADTVATAVGAGAVHIAWEDNRSGIDEVYAATSLDAGASFLPEHKLSTGGGSTPHVSGSGASVGVAWTTLSFPNSVHGAFTQDGGGTWHTGFTVSDTAGDADFATIAYSGSYSNYTCIWLDDAGAVPHVRCGGFRPQTLSIEGIAAGGSVSRFRFQSFRPAAVFALVLLSLETSAGGITTADGRALGIADDPLTSLGWQNVFLLWSPLDSAGAGKTPPLATQLPPGFRFHAVGIGFDASLAAGPISDVLTISL